MSQGAIVEICLRGNDGTLRNGGTSERRESWSGPGPIVGATRFHEIVASEELRILRSRRPSSLLVYPKTILGANGGDQRAIRSLHGHRLGKRTIVGYLGASHLGLLLCGVELSRAQRIAQTIRDELAPDEAGSLPQEMYALGPAKMAEPADPLHDRVHDAVVGSQPEIRRRWAMPAWKRALDVVLALIALILHIPLMILLAIAIKLVSRGPVFFWQERVGFRGETFRCCKFRSMHLDAPEEGHREHLAKLIRDQGPMKKLDQKADERLIPFGRFLRASALDELPQLLNVLRGDMSLVGPRPAIPYEYEEYEPWQKGRFDAIPGMTGLWQVSGKNQTTFNEMIRMDIRYAYLKSFWLDLRILAATPRVVVAQIAGMMKKDGAHHEKVVENGSSWVRVLGPQSDT